MDLQPTKKSLKKGWGKQFYMQMILTHSSKNCCKNNKKKQMGIKNK
jgi:hypothetical protein